VSPAKTAEPIEMSFGLWSQVGLSKRVLDGGPNPPLQRVNFDGEGAAFCQRALFVLSCSRLNSSAFSPAL